MTPRACCVCGATKRTGPLVRYRQAEVPGGPAQWICADTAACVKRATAV